MVAGGAVNVEGVLWPPWKPSWRGFSAVMEERGHSRLPACWESGQKLLQLAGWQHPPWLLAAAAAAQGAAALCRAAVGSSCCPRCWGAAHPKGNAAVPPAVAAHACSCHADDVGTKLGAIGACGMPLAGATRGGAEAIGLKNAVPPVTPQAWPWCRAGKGPGRLKECCRLAERGGEPVTLAAGKLRAVSDESVAASLIASPGWAAATCRGVGACVAASRSGPLLGSCSS